MRLSTRQFWTLFWVLSLFIIGLITWFVGSLLYTVLWKVLADWGFPVTEGQMATYIGAHLIFFLLLLALASGLAALVRNQLFYVAAGSDSIEAIPHEKEESPTAQTLAQILRVTVPGQLFQFRRGDFEKFPAQIQGWQFMCQNVTITNRSSRTKLSLDVTLRIKMKRGFSVREWILRESGDRIWGRHDDALPRPLALDRQDTKTGSFYFWTGPMNDENLRENLSDFIERENMLPLAFLDIQDLITEKSMSVPIPSEKGTLDNSDRSAAQQPSDIINSIPDLRISDDPTIIALFESVERDKLLPLLELEKLGSWARPMTAGEPPLTKLPGKVWSTHYLQSLSDLGPGTKTQSFLKTRTGQKTSYYDVYLNRAQIERIWRLAPVLRPMHEAVTYISTIIGDNDLKERFPKTRQQIRQAALDAKIRIRGRKSAQLMGARASYSAVETDIPAAYWETADIGALATSGEAEDMSPHTFPHQFSDGHFGEHIFLYSKLRVNWTEIIRVWSPS